MHLKHIFRLLCTFPLFVFASEKPVKVFILAGDELVLEQGLIEGRTDGVFDAFYPNAQKTACNLWSNTTNHQTTSEFWISRIKNVFC